MTVRLDAYMQEKKAWIDRQLPLFLQDRTIPGKLKESMLYSLTAGGKRIRPILLFAALDTLGKEEDLGLSTAVALEMIHTYSLIHDDLPAMDNDDLRRGKPTNHKMFGEATAILAGDGLLTVAFQIVASDPILDGEVRSRLVALLAGAAGPEGMVGGQEDDLEAEEKTLTLGQLMSVHGRKTGRLVRFPLEAAAVIAGATEQQTHSLAGYADHLGLAFQIGDDILDITGNEDELGKPVGSDLDNHKNTYVSLLKLEGAKRKMADHVDHAVGFLRESGFENGLLAQIAEFVLNRTF
ncbi:polyprenyl synthetase family protein [Sporolactobacillus sp. CQH2019]|uniref:polyprenyl synthetase family protein n=1 Tax=Sporolactobacillus sp. CQH2019 TaxID=3023512 RepID=UPI0023686D0A|nr:farnesyl diphosphate synthase [Sporolactobacillus sp. CQH2019]MDD9149305.1 polyprenyl synthetase family protein [Sporolactobacillus sp. CQH2019]